MSDEAMDCGCPVLRCDNCDKVIHHHDGVCRACAVDVVQPHPVEAKGIDPVSLPDFHYCPRCGVPVLEHQVRVVNGDLVAICDAAQQEADHV